MDELSVGDKGGRFRWPEETQDKDNFNFFLMSTCTSFLLEHFVNN